MQVPSREEFRSIELVCAEDQAGMRLDAFLSAHAPDLQRSMCKDAIQAGRVEIDGVAEKKLKASYKVQAGQQVRANLPLLVEASLPASQTEVEVLFEDEHIFVFNKPAGMATHPQRVDDTSTLASVVLRHCPDAPCPDGEELRPGIVHRLDADTSGAIVCAKTSEGMLGLKEQFKAGEVDKRYLAVVHGTPDKMQFSMTTPIGRDPQRPQAMRLDKERGKPAHTEFRGVERFRGFALEEAILLTGRTHQIRVHLQARGFPIVADRLYSPSKALRLCDINAEIESQQVVIDRQALHSAYLAFTHPVSGEELAFQAPLADDFSALLEALREHAPW